VVASRVRLNVCNITTPTGGVALAVDPAAVADESFVVLGSIFAGAGAVTSGVGPSSVKAFFKLNLELQDTAPRAAYSISDNVTGFVATQNVAFKLVGTTTPRASQLFTVATTNRAEYIGSKARTFLVIITGTLAAIHSHCTNTTHKAFSSREAATHQPMSRCRGSARRDGASWKTANAAKPK
jgi:hypothetical protein